MNSTPSKSSLAKIGFYLTKPKSLKVVILGQGGIGKSAMVVRFLTKRFIGDYDPTLEKVYTFQTTIDSELINFEIMDTAAQSQENECPSLEANIRWAEAFILMYSVTDKCSFDECNRLKFLINYNKRRRRLGGGSKEGFLDHPVVLVGNKADQNDDRMVSHEEGQRKSKEIGCVCFHEISVRESIDQVWAVFSDVCRFWRIHNKRPSKFRRAISERDSVSPDTIRLLCSAAISPSAFECIPNNNKPLGSFISRSLTDKDIQEDEEEADNVSNKDDDDTHSSGDKTPFRERASTDGHLQEKKPWRWRYQSPDNALKQQMYFVKAERRMSISMKGNNSSY